MMPSPPSPAALLPLDRRTPGRVETFTFGLGDSGVPTPGSGVSVEPSGNTITANRGLLTQNQGGNLVIDAAGNTWTPSQQGADAQGHYSGSLVTSGCDINFCLDGSGISIQF